MAGNDAIIADDNAVHSSEFDIVCIVFWICPTVRAIDWPATI